MFVHIIIYVRRGHSYTTSSHFSEFMTPLPLLAQVTKQAYVVLLALRGDPLPPPSEETSFMDGP